MNPPGFKIADVVAIAKQAGGAIMQQLNEGIIVTDKSDASPVTDADGAADAVIKKGLHALTPAIPIVSEEDTPQERKAALQSKIKWMVDPLDGTKTAIGYANGHKSYDQFGVHIALMRDGVPTRGVVYFPAMAEGKGVAYFTGDDGKAYKQTGDAAPREIHVSKPPFKEGLRMAVHLHEDRRPESITGRAYVPVPGVGGQRICLVAEGAADVADMNDIRESHRGKYAYKQWDVMAAQAVLKAAGGELVSDQTKQPVTHDAADFTVPGAFAGGIDTLNYLQLAESLRPGSTRSR